MLETNYEKPFLKISYQAIGVLESLKYDLLNAMREANSEDGQ